MSDDPIVAGARDDRLGRIWGGGHGGQVESDATAAEQAAVVPFVGHGILEAVDGEKDA